MTAVLKSTELIDAAIARINASVGAAEISFTPLLVQEGDLSFYAEDPTLANNVPAIFVKATDVGIDIGSGGLATDLTGDLIETTTALRIVLVDSWADGHEVVDRKTQRIQEVAQAFIRGAGAAYNMGASISGYTIYHALPVSIELEPPEDAAVSLDKERQLYACAFTIIVRGRAARS